MRLLYHLLHQCFGAPSTQGPPESFLVPPPLRRPCAKVRSPSYHAAIVLSKNGHVGVMKGYVGYIREIAEEGPLIASFFLASCLTALLFWHPRVGIWAVHQVSVVLRLSGEKKRRRVHSRRRASFKTRSEWWRLVKETPDRPSVWIVPSSESPWCQSP